MRMISCTLRVQVPPGVAGEAEEEIQRALYVGNTSAAVDAALQVGGMLFKAPKATLLCHALSKRPVMDYAQFARFLWP